MNEVDKMNAIEMHNAIRNAPPVIIDKSLLDMHRCDDGGFNMGQLACLGVRHPVVGWMKHVIGRQVSFLGILEIRELRNKQRSEEGFWVLKYLGEDFVIVDEYLIDMGRSPLGQLSEDQMVILGASGVNPHQAGFITGILGRRIPITKAREFVSLRLATPPGACLPICK